MVSSFALGARYMPEVVSKTLYDEIEALIPTFQSREPELDELGSFPFENVKALVDLGYTKLILPEAYGGVNLSAYELVKYQTLIAKGDGATAISIGWHMGTLLGLRNNTAWPQQTYDFLLQKVAQGALINLVMSERGSGSPTRGGTMQTTATKVEGGYVLNGHKAFATLSPMLDYFISGVNLDGEDSFFLIPRHTDGVSILPVWDSVALRGSASHDIVLNDVFVPDHFLVQQADIANSVIRSPGGLLHIPACYLGIAEAARDYALHFATTYIPKSLGKPIIETIPTQQKIGEIELLLKQSRYILHGVAKEFDDGTVQLADLLAAKTTVVNHAITITDLAMRICGAQSLGAKSPLHRYYLHVRAGLHNPPTDDEILTLLAKATY